MTSTIVHAWISFHPRSDLFLYDRVYLQELGSDLWHQPPREENRQGHLEFFDGAKPFRVRNFGPLSHFL